MCVSDLWICLTFFIAVHCHLWPTWWLKQHWLFGFYWINFWHFSKTGGWDGYYKNGTSKGTKSAGCRICPLWKCYHDVRYCILNKLNLELSRMIQYKILTGIGLLIPFQLFQGVWCSHQQTSQWLHAGPFNWRICSDWSGHEDTRKGKGNLFVEWGILSQVDRCGCEKICRCQENRT